MDQLSTTKKITECAFDAKNMPWDVVMECLKLREGRMAIDSVRDEVEAELKKARFFIVITCRPICLSLKATNGQGRSHGILSDPDGQE